jgi:hypothetical protein
MLPEFSVEAGVPSEVHPASAIAAATTVDVRSARTRADFEVKVVPNQGRAASRPQSFVHTPCPLSALAEAVARDVLVRDFGKLIPADSWYCRHLFPWPRSGRAIYAVNAA